MTTENKGQGHATTAMKIMWIR